MPPKKRKAPAKSKAETPPKKAKRDEATESGGSGACDGIIRIEYCKSWRVFKTKATQIFAELCDLLPEWSLEQELVVGARGAFEIYVRKSSKAAKEGALVWTGVKKGPPRKEKFPEPASLVPAIEKILK